MMNGATIPRPSQARTRDEATTSAASQPHAGIRRALLTTKLDLGEPPGELPRLRRIRGDPDVRRGLAQLPEHRVSHCLPARRLLERGGVELRNPPEIVPSTRQLPRRGTHFLPHVLPRHEELESRGKGLDL